MKQPIISNKPPKTLVLEETYFINLAPYGLKITLAIDEGFEWDGASIPRVFWITIGSPYNPIFMTAGLIHDYLYRYQPVERKDADKVFHKILRENGVGRINAFRMYMGVRMGGFIPWNKHKKNLK